jgi:hypothetical protein
MNPTTSGSGSADQRGPMGHGPVGQGPNRKTGAVRDLASGPTLFAVLMLVAGGAFQVLEGLAALIGNRFFFVTQSYAYRIDITAWGWLHLILGIVLIAVSIAVLLGSLVARFVAMGLAVLSAVAHFLFIPYQPIWSVLIIAVDVAVIWALAGFERPRF